MFDQHSSKRLHWSNRSGLGIGLASLFSDWSHEIAPEVMPAFRATMGVAANMIRRLGVLVLVLASGCTLTRVDIAGKPQYPTDYAVGQVLRLKQALILERPGGTLNFSPPYLLKDARDTRRVIGVVEPGTTLRVTRIMRGHYPGLESWGEVYAEILSGPYRSREVEITAISRKVQQEKPFMRVPWIDPNLLQRVEE